MITREQIEAKLADLHRQRQQLIANGNAVNGAIQALELLLADDAQGAVEPDVSRVNAG